MCILQLSFPKDLIPYPNMTSQDTKKLKVFVGLSGGVDSSVSAALLKKQDYEVTGVFIKVWTPDFIECTWKEDRLDAMRVCAKLQIPFITLDLSKEYKKEVVDYMIAEYKAGRTPNPDVMCNRYVKFGGFYDFARENGADYVATGHYARVLSSSRMWGSRLDSRLHGNDNLVLATGNDDNKDQSYFLWTLKQEQLAHTLFPVGHLEKPEVRKLAKKFGLPTADKKDSQGLCFLGKIDVKEFLKHFIKPKKGNVLNTEGEVIGTHDGAFFFTLGERHGFTTLVARTVLDEEAKPYYVVAKDVKDNTLTVSHDPKRSADGELRTTFEIKDLNWINGTPATGKSLFARIRYRQPLQGCNVDCATPGVAQSTFAKVSVHFTEAQTGGAAGQSIVFYDAEVCLGGGVIA